MESEKVFKDSYEYLEQLCKENMTDNISIDYTKLDCKTKGIIKDHLQSIIMRRRKEIGRVLFKAQ